MIACSFSYLEKSPLKEYNKTVMKKQVVSDKTVNFTISMKGTI